MGPRGCPGQMGPAGPTGAMGPQGYVGPTGAVSYTHLVDGYGIPIRFDEKILFVKARRSKHRRFHAIYKPFITAWLT